MLKLGAEIAGVAFSAAFVKDLLNGKRLSAISTAAKDSWRSGVDLDHNRLLIKENAGRFAFDTGLMMAGGTAGASLGRFGIALPSAAGDLLPGNVSTSAPRPLALRATDTSYYPGVQARGNSLQPPLEVFPTETSSLPGEAGQLASKAANISPSLFKEPRPISWRLPDGKTWQWEPSEATGQTLRDARTFVASFMSRDYLGALATAIESPVMKQVELNPASRRHDVRFLAADLNEPESMRALMSRMNGLAKFQWGQFMRNGEFEPQKLDVVVPRAIIELKEGQALVPLVDFAQAESGGYKIELPNRTTDGKPLTVLQTEEIGAIRQSSQGQRLIAEMGLMAFEESIVHANQHISAGGDIISPTYAEFARDFSIEHGTRAHKLAFLGLLDRSNPVKEAFYEQEVPAVLYDAGMPLPLIERHYFAGAHHVQERTPVIEFLRKKAHVRVSAAS